MIGYLARNVSEVACYGKCYTRMNKKFACLFAEKVKIIDGVVGYVREKEIFQGAPRAN